MHQKSLQPSLGLRARIAVLPCLVIASFISCLNAQNAEELPGDTQNPGYFPTIAEDTLLRGAADSRSLGRGLSPYSVDGPDGPAQTASGLFRYYDNEPDFYQRNQDFFRPLNRGLGVFTPHDALAVESSRLQNASFTVDGSLGLLTRTFEPELAHVKAGPLYFDVLWVGAGAIYTDYNGSLPQDRHDQHDDGFAAYVELGVRGLLRITDSIYISAVANVMYLPFENEVALRFGNGDDPPLLLRFTITEQLGEWEVMFFDEFRGVTGLDFLVNADSPAIDRAGRYYYGFINERSSDFYTSNDAYFVNTVGFYASRPTFDNQWRLGLGIERSDFWRTFSFENHSKRDWFAIWMQYEGSSIPFAPRFSYQYMSNDGYDSLLHQFQLELTGRLTENLNWYSMAGYAFQTGDADERNRFVWSVDLEHTLTTTTQHRLTAGQGYFYHEFSSDTRAADYIRYAIDQRITSRLDARIFAQYTHNESSAEDLFPMRDRFGGGFRLTYRPLDFTDIRALVYYDQADQSTVEEDSSRWLYRLELNQQLGFRLTGKLFYQYEEFNRAENPYTEHLVGVSLRRYF
ncbi:hypothetical protein SAMN02745166_00818 [Prosthecobacter debontii]|uniref:TIGR03016 family PEP-CTERM system-associated outer membrane protein n=2 Tax=Prosthecobacter debontii TaxID=48467 RepID=A0A1T4WY83_9BACT|nr:hypothetical protein SAMN02745166_00818 [Prosthecobacter debontii]